MAKFNTGSNVTRQAAARKTSPVRTRVASGGAADTVTHEGGAGYSREPKGELFLLAVSNMVGEKSFYEGADARDTRFRGLVARVAVDDPAWMFDFLRWLRAHGNMRSASLVGAVEAVRAWQAERDRTKGNVEAWAALENRFDAWRAARPDEEARDLPRALIDAVCQRADEPGELLAYWFGRYGRKLPAPIKRGLADAVRRLYTEYAMLKYDTATRGGGGQRNAGGFRFGDVLELVHPRPSDWTGNAGEPGAFDQGALFKYAIDRRHDRQIDRAEQRLDLTLPMVDANHTLRWLAAPEGKGAGDPSALLDPDNVRAAGMTWEDVLSLGGSAGLDKRDLWESVIPSMGYMALLRNLRNFDETGVSDQVADRVAARLADPNRVARSRQFPFRFYSAYKAAPSLRWAKALDRALTLSVGNIPVLPGRTLVLIDTSGSMTYGKVSDRSRMTYAEVAALFGVALAVRAAQPGADGTRAEVEIHGFGDSTFAHQVRKGGSLLTELERFNRRNGEAGHGTDIGGAVARTFGGQDRVIILSDMQTMDGGRFSGFGYGRRSATKVDRLVPRDTPVYGFNLGGYAAGAMPSGSGNRHEFGGGLTDAAFRLLPLLEAGRNGVWPWVSGA